MGYFAKTWHFLIQKMFCECKYMKTKSNYLGVNSR